MVVTLLGQQYNVGEKPTFILYTFRRYFQHAHFIPIVGVGGEAQILIGP